MAPATRTTLVSSSPSVDNEAASQQLLAEASSPVRRNAATIAGAAALNAALNIGRPPAFAPPARPGGSGKLSKPGQLKRVSLPSSAAGLSGQPERAGKLKRTSLVSPPDHQKKARGAKLYDIQPSPQKRSSLPAQVAAFEDDELQGTPATGDVEDMVPETSQVQPEEDVAAEIPESAPQSDVVVAPDDNTAAAVPDIAPASPKQPRRSDASSTTGKSRGRPPKRKSDESVESSLPFDVATIPPQVEDEPPVVNMQPKQKTRRKDEQTAAAAANAESSGKMPAAKKRRKLNGPRTVDPETVEVGEALPTPHVNPSLPLQQDARPSSRGQPEGRVPIRSTRLRAAEAEAAEAKDKSATAIVAAASEQQDEPAASSSRVTQSTKAASKPNKRKITQQSVPEDSQLVAKSAEDDPQPEDDSQPTDEQPQEVESATDHTVDLRMSDNGAEELPGDEEIDVQQPEQQAEQPDEEVNETQGAQVDAERTTSAVPQADPNVPRASSILDVVFQFVDSDERSGECSTNLGRSIRRACTSARVTLSQSGEASSLEDIARCRDDIFHLLKSAGAKVREARRVVFKRDAFTYLFYSLTLVLEAMHDKLRESVGDITASLVAMQIICPFIRGMLVFKGMMDAWKVSVPQHTQGDRLIKSVESGLIVPLRTVDKRLQTRFGQLKKVEQAHQAFLHLQRKREEEERELIRKEEALRPVKNRRERWQNLHIVRMQCESDPVRRRRLRFIELPSVTETDANGQPFERVPFFGQRSGPPPQLAAVSSGREWTKEQETVLLDALQSATSLESIFRQHCVPGGPLRDFSVSDFAAKMAWVQSGWAQLSHRHGWEVPEWVKKIPVLP